MGFLNTSIRQSLRRWFGRDSAEAPVTSPPLQGNWVIPGRLMVGPRPRTAQQSRFAALGFRGWLTLHSEAEAAVPDWVPELVWRRIPLPDSHVEETLSIVALGEAVATLAGLLETHAPVYVHCIAGIERSPLVCLGYLCRYRGMTLTSALNHLQQMHPSTCPTPEQLKVLRLYLSQEESGLAVS